MITKKIFVEKDDVLNFVRKKAGNFFTNIIITKPGIKLVVNEVFDSKGEVVSKLVVEHKAKSTVSRINIKGVVGKDSKAVSHSVVSIPKDIEGCDTDLVQKFLVLHESGFAEAEPSLEVEPSKVKAAHALSISPINPEELFYLQTRGLTSKQATKLIVENFLK